jgi:hypothetical protein
MNLFRRQLNGLQPRTARELWRDPRDWWESQEPEHVSVIYTDTGWIARAVRWLGRWWRR